ncbi:MAG: hypothetical protein GKR94_11425 [Gammaproteobacteria bacterium]|nr:hypothetical protein [Gammaproteobacteria bacterium]
MVRANLPPVDPFLGKRLSRYPEHPIVDHLGSGNNGHVFRACDSTIGSDIALKFVPVENLKDNLEEDEYRLEARLPNTIRHPSVVKYTRAFRWTVPDDWNAPEIGGREFVVFECEYVDGKSLREFAKEARRDLSIPFVKQFLECMFELLFELTERPDRIQHGDLHDGNILVEPPKYDVYGRFRFRITDFGASEFALSSAHRSDFLSVANILRSLLESLPGRPSSALERYEFEVLRNDFLSRHLIETDKLADHLAQNPRDLLQKLNAMEVQFLDARDERTGDNALTTPFDYPNCEQIGSSNLLLKNLYSERVLGLHQIESRTNTVVTGPRGCGKTTVFRALSLDYRISVGSDAPAEIRYIGSYYRCDDLYFSFPRYQLPEDDNGLDVPMHFLVVILVAGLLKSIRSWSKRRFPNSLVAVEARMCDDIRELSSMEPAKDPSGSTIEGLVSALENRQRRRAQRKQQHLHKEQATGYCGPEALVRIVALLREHAPFLADRPLYFFIDDYSEPKITLDLQRNLNRLLMNRGADMFFKISTESPISFAKTDVDGKAYVENREYELLNLGLRFLESLPQGLEFLRTCSRSDDFGHLT